MTSRPFHILLLSADRFLLRRASKFLEVFGYSVHQAADAAHALAAAETTHPDFFIVDSASAGQAGVQLCRSVRRVAKSGYTCCLLLTDDPDATHLTEALEAGFDDFLSQPVVFGELLSRLRTGARVIEFERRLVNQTGIDRATNLPDKNSLLLQLQDLTTNARAAQNHLALLDLDFFARVAARLGNAASDTLLQAVADFWQDAVGDYFLAAVPANRFGVVLEGVPLTDAMEWCQTLLRSLAGHEFQVEAEKFQITASCGIAEIAGGEQPEAIFQKAVGALRLAKSSGRHCVATNAEVESEAEAWTQIAVAGRMFETTVARDVMTPCALLLSAEETIEAAQALLQHTQLDAAAVIDREGLLVGLLTEEQLEDLEAQPVKQRSSNSVRLVRQVMQAEVPTFSESTSLAQLMEFFTTGEQALAVVVRNRRPTGIVHCHGLAALNDRLTTDNFLPTLPVSSSSDYLLVPDLCLAETS